MVKQGHFGAKSIENRLDETLNMWQHLLDLTAARRKRLEEAVDFHQVLAEFIDYLYPKLEFSVIHLLITVVVILGHKRFSCIKNMNFAVGFIVGTRIRQFFNFIHLIYLEYVV